MGQMTVGIMYGAPLPDGINAYCDEPGNPGILERYKQRIVGKRRSQKALDEADHATPDQDYESAVVGFWIAIDRGSDEHGCGEIKSCAIDAIGSIYSEQVSSAEARWAAFTRWAQAEHGVTFVAPSLWLAVTEVS